MLVENAQYIDTEAEFLEYAGYIKTCSWFGFDTEFIGEKSFIPKLCLLQVVTDQGVVLLDTLKIGDLSPLLTSIVNPDILKITHAGDNDYRLLYQLYGVVPQNTFDTQIAAGFCGYNYPAGFSKLVGGELHIKVKKGYAVADWEARPLSDKILHYAVEDVLHLPGLWESLSNCLKKNNRTEWAREENKVWENEDFYHTNPYKEAFSSDFIHQLRDSEKLFLMRIYAWRLDVAKAKDVPKEMVLPNKHISSIVKAIGRGGNAMKGNRTLPNGLVRKYSEIWDTIYNAPITLEEQAIIDAIPPPPPDNPQQIWSLELAYHLVKKACLDNDISPSLLLPRGIFNQLKDPQADFDKSQLTGWRSEMLGKELINWLLNRDIMDVAWKDGTAVLYKTNS